MTTSLSAWGYARKSVVLLIGAFVGTTIVFKIYNPLEQMQTEIEDGKAVILREYAPRYEELRKKLAKEVAKIEKKEALAKLDNK